MLLHTFSLLEPSTNNVAEYKALLINIKIAHELGTQHLKVYGDSMLIINQVCGEFVARHEMVPYHAAASHIAGLFKIFDAQHIPRNHKSYVDALPSLATSLALQLMH